MNKINQLLKTFKEVLNFSNLVDIFKHPEFHAREIPVLLAIFSLFTLAIIIYYYLVVYKQEEKLAPTPASLRKYAYLFAASVGLTILFLYIPVQYFMSARSCLQCHKSLGNHNPYLESVHINVDCKDCHLNPVFLNRMENLLNLTKKIATLNFSRNPKLTETCCVSSLNCLQCHRYVLYETVTSKYIRVSHREIFSKFKNCLDCHNFRLEKLPSEELIVMGKCGSCHDGISVKNSCDFCHTILSSPSKFKPDLLDYPKVTEQGENPVKEGKEPTPAVNIKEF